jgi:flavin reductase (DIM6/NTAB) family NADH-FMN oxidoreductase RutF
MFYDAVKNDHGFEYDPFKALVAPRPIAWVSSLSASGDRQPRALQLFQRLLAEPALCGLRHRPGEGHAAQHRGDGEFAVSLPTWELREQMNATSAHVGPEVDEFELARLTKAPCRLIGVPRVAESPVALECRLFQVVPLPDDKGHAEDHMVIGRVLGIHIDDRYINDGRVDTAAMRPIARLGYSEYATVTEAWRMRRPA